MSARHRRFCVLWALVVSLDAAVAFAQVEFASYDDKNRTTPEARLVVAPAYPAAFTADKLQGFLDLEFGLGLKGTMTATKVVAGDLPDAFSLATLDAAKFWIFRAPRYGSDCRDIDVETQRYLLRAWFEFDGEKPKISISQPAYTSDPAHGPALVFRETPKFPVSAIRKRIEHGCVFVRIHVSETGEVMDVDVVESKPKGVFDMAVRDAAMKFRWGPSGSHRGDTEAIAVLLQVNFALVDQ